MRSGPLGSTVNDVQLITVDEKMTDKLQVLSNLFLLIYSTQDIQAPDRHK